MVLREIILNEQRDTRFAQEVLKNYKENIAVLNAQIAALGLEDKKNKTQIKNLKKSVEYMEVLFKDMNRFASSFEVGMNNL